MRTATSTHATLGGAATRPTIRTRAGRWATAGRFVLLIYFFLMAGVNVFITLPTAVATYDGLATLSWPHFAWIPKLISGTFAVPFTMALIAWELALVVLLLRSGVAVRVALWAALLQMLALAPFLGWYELANLATAVLVGALLTRDHDRTAVDVLRRRR
jgi:hypothetical protein